MRRAWLVSGVVGLLAGGCERSLQDDPVDSSSDTGPDEPPVVDSDDGPPPRCAVDEVEPNDRLNAATPLPMERRGCGTLASGTDQDHWAWTLPEKGWVEVRVDAASLGSRGDVYATVGGGPDALGVTSFRTLDSADVRLVLPMAAGDYTTLVGPDGAQGGGDEAFYEVRASVTKPPVAVDRTEGDNDAVTDPQALTDAVTSPAGLVVLGGFDRVQDVDHYAIDVPPGRHRVRVAVEAAAHGSPADAVLTIDPAGDAERIEDADLGPSPDPAWEGTTAQAERLVVAVASQDGRTGPGIWYALRVTVEAAP